MGRRLWPLLGLAACPAWAQQPAVEQASAAAGPPALFTADQPARGRAVYAMRCAQCHGRDLTGGSGPALAGPQFFTRQMGTRLSGFFAYLVHEMPQDRPGSLSHAQCADVMAYILDRNGFPSGSEGLTYESALTSAAIVYFATQP